MLSLLQLSSTNESDNLEKVGFILDAIQSSYIMSTVASESSNIASPGPCSYELSCMIVVLLLVEIIPLLLTNNLQGSKVRRIRKRKLEEKQR